MSNPIRYIIYGDGRDFRSQPNNWIFYLVWGIFTFCMGIIYLCYGHGLAIDSFLDRLVFDSKHRTVLDALTFFHALIAFDFLLMSASLKRRLGIANDVLEEEGQANSLTNGGQNIFNHSYGWGFYLVFFLFALFAGFSHMVQGVGTRLDLFLSTGLPWPQGAALYDVLYVLLGLYAVFCLVSFPNLKRNLGIARAEEEKEEQEEARRQKAARERAAEQAAKESSGKSTPPG